jgi:hypothetical protein
MPTLDTTAKTAVEGSAFAPAFFIWLDINGDSLRVTNFGADVTFAGTGDTDLDGEIFTAFAGSALDVSEISNSEQGSDTLTVTLSGIVSMDTSLVDDIADKSLWQGRTARIWTRIYDETGVTPQGAIVPLYTGYMSSVRIRGTPEMQAIELSIENYLAFFSEASNRSYLNQSHYDASDKSAAATMAASNGLRRNTGAGGGGGFFGELFRRGRERRHVN